MNIVFYTNCQWRGIKPYLEKIYTKAKFVILENYVIINEQLDIDYDALKIADIFIYQPIGLHHGKYSTNMNLSNNILSFLPTKCKKISMPYIYNNAFWILIPPSHGDAYIGEYGNMNKYINAEPILKLKNEGKSLREVLYMYNNNMIDFDFENRFNKSLNILKEKETLCDIKVSEFIRENAMKHKLFFTQNHPTTCVFVHVVNQILRILKVDHEFDKFPQNINICDLNVYWYHTSYDKNYYTFLYENPDTLYNPQWYEKHIINIFRTITK